MHLAAENEAAAAVWRGLAKQVHRLSTFAAPHLCMSASTSWSTAFSAVLELVATKLKSLVPAINGPCSASWWLGDDQD